MKKTRPRISRLISFPHSTIHFSKRVSNFQLLSIQLHILIGDITSLHFDSWWVEGKEKNMITVVYRLDGNPHEVTIKDTKYFVKELYACEKHKGQIITVSVIIFNLSIFKSVGIFLSEQRLIFSENPL